MTIRPQPEVPLPPPNRLFMLSDRLARIALNKAIPQELRIDIAKLSFEMHEVAKDVNRIAGIDRTALDRAIEGLKTLIKLQGTRA